MEPLPENIQASDGFDVPANVTREPISIHPDPYSRNSRPVDTIIDDDLELHFNVMLKLLSPERFNNMTDATIIGRAFHHHHNGSNVGYRAWIRLLKVKPPPLSTYRLYSRLPRLTTKTLMLMAKEDRPGDFQTWHMGWAQRALDIACKEFTEVSVTDYIYRHVVLMFTYCPDTVYDLPPGFWMYFNPSWSHCGGDGIMYNYITKHIASLVKSQIVARETANSTETDDTAKASGDNAIKALNRVYHKIRHVKSVVSLMTGLKHNMRDKYFADLLDSDGYLLGFKNGIMDFSSGKPHFRRGRPEDYVSKSTQVEYDANLTYDDPTVKRIMEWVSQVYMDPQLLEYVLMYCASCMVAGNTDKIFPIFNGAGDNSKSMVQTMLLVGFGDYATTASTAVLTGKKQSAERPSPTIVNFRNRRLIIFSEPDDETERINIGVLKEFTGMDDIYVRQMWSGRMIKIKCTYKMMLCCNDIPEMKITPAVQRRLAVIPHESTWSENAPVSLEDQYKQRTFKSDPHFATKIAEWGPAFMWILSQYYELWMQKTLANKPPAVVTATKSHANSADPYRAFIADHCAVGPNLKVQCSIFNAAFTLHPPHNIGKVIPSATAIKRQLTGMTFTYMSEGVEHSLKIDNNGPQGGPGSYYLGFDIIDRSVLPPPRSGH